MQVLYHCDSIFRLHGPIGAERKCLLANASQHRPHLVRNLLDRKRLGQEVHIGNPDLVTQLFFGVARHEQHRQLGRWKDIAPHCDGIALPAAVVEQIVRFSQARGYFGERVA